MFILLTIPMIVCVVWLFKMMVDLLNNELPDIAMKCFGIMVFLFTLYILLGKELI